MKVYGGRRLTGSDERAIAVEWAFDHIPLPFLRVFRNPAVIEVSIGFGAAGIDPVVMLWAYVRRPR